MGQWRRSRFFEGKNVVLTGGSSGIGRAIAVDLARQGANLLLIGRRQALLDETIILLESTRHDLAPIWESRAVDVSHREAIQSALQSYDEGRPVDILINCAGIAWAEYVDRMPPEAFEQTIQINYLGNGLVQPGDDSFVQAKARRDHCQCGFAGRCARFHRLCGLLAKQVRRGRIFRGPS